MFVFVAILQLLCGLALVLAVLFQSGKNSGLSGALTGGMSETKAMAFEDRDKIIATLKRLVKPGDVLLFKGSRGMHMELILEGFLKED